MAETAALPAEERVRELTADPKLTSDDANRYADLFLRAGKPAIARTSGSPTAIASVPANNASNPRQYSSYVSENASERTG